MSTATTSNLGPKWFQAFRKPRAATVPKLSSSEPGFHQRIREEAPDAIAELRDVFKAANDAVAEIGRASNGMHAATAEAKALLAEYAKAIAPDRKEAFHFARSKLGGANIDGASYLAVEFVRLRLDRGLVARALAEAREILASEKQAYADFIAHAKLEYGLEHKPGCTAERVFEHMQNAVQIADQFLRESTEAFGDTKLRNAAGQLLGTFA
ncbi:MAG: hypothetical protein JNJ82_15395 [Opitutaceae bacterium]|nr:hypothetical protein [Opitutaceae bacterium]